MDGMTDVRTPQVEGTPQHVLQSIVEPRRRYLRLGLRTAAERANMSEGTWRQLVAQGVMSGGNWVPRHPRRDQVLSMALAVGVLADAALQLNATPDEVEDTKNRSMVLDPAEDEIMHLHYLRPREKLLLLERLGELRKEV